MILDWHPRHAVSPTTFVTRLRLRFKLLLRL